MNLQIINSLPRSAFKDKYERQSWLNFASRVTKNPFMLDFLIRRERSKCSWCENTLYEKKTIHHISYDHFCSFNVIIRENRPTQKRPSRQAKVPDCKSCHDINKDVFIQCANKLTVVHPICNLRISTIVSNNINGSGK